MNLVGLVCSYLKYDLSPQNHKPVAGGTSWDRPGPVLLVAGEIARPNESIAGVPVHLVQRVIGCYRKLHGDALGDGEILHDRHIEIAIGLALEQASFRAGIGIV